MYLKMERFLFNNHYPTSSNISVHYHEESEGYYGVEINGNREQYRKTAQ